VLQFFLMKFLSISEDSWDLQKIRGRYRKSNTEVFHDFCFITDIMKMLKLINLTGGMNRKCVLNLSISETTMKTLNCYAVISYIFCSHWTKIRLCTKAYNESKHGFVHVCKITKNNFLLLSCLSVCMEQLSSS